jgi:hypothetical protein
MRTGGSLVLALRVVLEEWVTALMLLSTWRALELLTAQH